MHYGFATVRAVILSHFQVLTVRMRCIDVEWTFNQYNTSLTTQACAGPGFQLRQYYRYGNVSDCREFWDAFYNCLKKRTAFADQVSLLQG